MTTPIRIDVVGEETLAKKVAPGGSESGRIYLPKKWLGRTVLVVLLPEGEKKKEE